MPISEANVTVDGVYITSTDQLRKVTRIEDGKVHYWSAGANTKNPWNYGHSKAGPPSMDAFVHAVDRKLDDKEIATLVGDRAQPK